MNPKPRWQTVVFDLDGTLCNTIDLILASFDHAHREVLGEQLDPQVARGWIGRTLPDIYAAWPDQAEALRASYLDFNLANLERLQTSFDGIAELLTELREAGVVLGIATSKQRTSADRSLAASGLTGLVPVVSSMGETTHHKPHPEPIQHALAGLGADSADAVYVGDAVVDVQAAQAAGISQIAVTWGAGDRTELMLANPTATVDSVDELARVLLG
ncbi:MULTISPECIES: HAD family hydrolase [unclassified Luteococcus]|uniref:HAD family hydrolase n=1 Tax=unclassified Luteococcus TaxID=2639923 RepID=UPI00313B4BC7